MMKKPEAEAKKLDWRLDRRRIVELAATNGIGAFVPGN